MFFFAVQGITIKFTLPDCKNGKFQKKDDLIHTTLVEQELAELLLRRFKNSSDIQDWEETLAFTKVAQYGPEDDEPLFMCKNYPKCNSSLLDMMPQEDA